MIFQRDTRSKCYIDEESIDTYEKYIKTIQDQISIYEEESTMNINSIIGNKLQVIQEENEDGENIKQQTDL